MAAAAGMATTGPEGLVTKVRPVTVSPALVESFAPPTADQSVFGVLNMHDYFREQSADSVNELMKEGLEGLHSSDTYYC